LLGAASDNSFEVVGREFVDDAHDSLFHRAGLG